MQTTMDEAGRVAIPKELQTKLGLTPGIKLDVEAMNGAMTIKPISNGNVKEDAEDPPAKEGGLVWKGNVLVFSGEVADPNFDYNEFVRKLDEERDRQIWNPRG